MPSGRQLVDVRRLVELAAVAAQVGPAEVVDHDQDDVGAVGGGREWPKAEERDMDMGMGLMGRDGDRMSYKFELSY